MSDHRHRVACDRCRRRSTENRVSRLAVTIFAAGAAVSILSACSTITSPADRHTLEVVKTSPAASSDGRLRNDTGEYICGVSAITATANEERYLGYAIPTLHDSGPRDGAQGEARYDEFGSPVAYIVAAGDNFQSVELRFCTPGLYLEFVNSVRRGTLALYVGDTVNLSASKITSVGDANGVAHDYPLWRDGEAELPPQS